MDDQTIVTTLHSDEEAGLALLIDRYTPYVSAIIGGIAGAQLPIADREELAADVFFKVWQRRDGLRAESLKAYVAQVARNACIDRLRRSGAEVLPLEDAVLAVAVGERPDELAIAREQKQVINRLVEDLGEPEREIFIRYYYFGEKVNVIAGRLAMSPATVKTKLHRTRGVLKRILEERGYDCA